MKWSYRIARIKGIDVKLHITFILLLVFVAISTGIQEGWLIGLRSGLMICLIFFIVLLHEFGHSVVAIRFGAKVKDIILLPIGGLARMSRMPERPSQEVLIAMAGPAVNFVLAGASLVLMVVLGGAYTLTSIEADAPILLVFFGFNIFIGLFNLLPAFPMDGGRILRGLLANRLGYLTATKIAVNIGEVFALIFVIVGVLYMQLFLALIGIFIYIAATSEERGTELKMALSDVPVSRIMIGDLQVATPQTTLGQLLERFFHGYQEDFPVVQDQHLVGMLSKADLLAALHDRPKETPVDGVMSRNTRSVEPSATLSTVYRMMIDNHLSAVPVVSQNSLVGLVTLGQIARYISAKKEPRRRYKK